MPFRKINYWSIKKAWTCNRMHHAHVSCCFMAIDRIHIIPISLQSKIFLKFLPLFLKKSTKSWIFLTSQPRHLLPVMLKYLQKEKVSPHPSIPPPLPSTKITKKVEKKFANCWWLMVQQLWRNHWQLEEHCDQTCYLSTVLQTKV